MSNTTYARPYATAIFEYAKATHHLKDWAIVLDNLCGVLSDPAAYAFLKNPVTTVEQQFALLSVVLPAVADKTMYEAVHAFIDLLIAQKRVGLLPDIAAQYTDLRFAYEKLSIVQVRAYDALSSSEADALSKKLGERFGRQVTLEVIIDKTLLGGMVIQSGDWVLDGSVRSQLGQLAQQLTIM